MPASIAGSDLAGRIVQARDFVLLQLRIGDTYKVKLATAPLVDPDDNRASPPAAKSIPDVVCLEVQNCNAIATRAVREPEGSRAAESPA